MVLNLRRKEGGTLHSSGRGQLQGTGQMRFGCRQCQVMERMRAPSNCLAAVTSALLFLRKVRVVKFVKEGDDGDGAVAPSLLPSQRPHAQIRSSQANTGKQKSGIYSVKQ